MSAAPALPEGAVLQDDGSVRWPLRFPVTYKIGNEPQTLGHVTIRRKRWKDTLAVKDINNLIQEMDVTIARLTGLEPIIQAELDDYDAEMIAKIIGSFATPGPATPSSASA